MTATCAATGPTFSVSGSSSGRIAASRPLSSCSRRTLPHGRDKARSRVYRGPCDAQRDRQQQADRSTKPSRGATARGCAAAGLGLTPLFYDGDACVGRSARRTRFSGHTTNAHTLRADQSFLIWRCGEGYRGKGVAAAALAGALAQSKALGDGRVEAYLEDTEGRKASAAFLFGGAISTVERQGFKRSRQIGKFVVAAIVK